MRRLFDQGKPYVEYMHLILLTVWVAVAVSYLLMGNMTGAKWELVPIVFSILMVWQRRRDRYRYMRDMVKLAALKNRVGVD